jgi:hypothetical protein
VSITTRENLVIRKDEPKEYVSMYGYSKRGFYVYLASDTEFDNAIGFIKEERVIGVDGKTVGLAYYTRTGGWRNNGQERFFASPEALIIAFGGKLQPALVAKPRKKAVAKKAAAPKKRAKVVVKTKAKTSKRTMAALTPKPRAKYAYA